MSGNKGEIDSNLFFSTFDLESSNFNLSKGLSMIKNHSIEADVVRLSDGKLSICLKADGMHQLGKMISAEVAPSITLSKRVVRGKIHLTIFASFVKDKEERP